MTQPTRPPNLAAAIGGELAARKAAADAKAPSWAPQALDDIHRAMVDEFWFCGLPQARQLQIWNQREALIARGLLNPDTDLEAA